MATCLGLKSVAQSLLENGANVNTKNNGNDTALIWVTIKCNKEIVKIILENKLLK